MDLTQLENLVSLHRDHMGCAEVRVLVYGDDWNKTYGILSLNWDAENQRYLLIPDDDDRDVV